MKRVSERFPNLRAAAAWYGIAHGAFTDLKRMGAEQNDPLPFEDPGAMPAWFERMIDCGARKRPCPLSVLTRAAAEGGAAPPVTPQPRGKARAASGRQDLPPLRLDEESTPSSIISRQRRVHAALNLRFLEMVENRQDQTPEGMAIMRQISSLEKAILEWSKAEKELRDPDEWIPISEVQAGLTEFCKRLTALFDRELYSHFLPGDHDRVEEALSRFKDRIQTLLPGELTKAA